MKVLAFLLRKEFLQLIRTPSIFQLLLIAPVVQLLLLPLAANYEVKKIKIALIDHDRSSYSKNLTSHIFASGHFILVGIFSTYRDGFHQIQIDKADLVLEIPSQFEKGLKNGNQKLLIAVNAINGIKASLTSTYLASVIMKFNKNIYMNLNISPDNNRSSRIVIKDSYWYNFSMVYFLLMVPGIIVNLLTGIVAMASALNIVKEKESGTIEQINVSPVSMHYFIAGKLIPFAIIGIIVFTLGLCISRFIYGIQCQGSMFLVYTFSMLFIFTMLALGLLISTYSKTQQQALSLLFFSIMILSMMSGLFTPLDSMPQWAKTIAHLLPTTYFIEAIRMIMLKGSGISDVAYHFAAIFIIGILLGGWALINYKKMM